jgi:hypothetical protein
MDSVIAIQTYIDNVFKLIIFVITLALASMALTGGHIIIWTISTLMTGTSIAYGFYICYNFGKLLLSYPGYNSINLIYYYVQIFLITVLYLFTSWFYLRRHFFVVD